MASYDEHRLRLVVQVVVPLKLSSTIRREISRFESKLIFWPLPLNGGLASGGDR